MAREDELHCRIKALRKKSGYTQKQVAEYMGVDVSTYAHYEKGDRTPNAQKLKILAQLYKLNDEMLGAQLPVETFVSYRREDLKRFKKVLDECKWHKDDYILNRQQYSILKDAVEPILKTRDEALSLSQLDTNKMINEQFIVKVKLDCLGEALISRYIKESHVYYEMMNGRYSS